MHKVFITGASSGIGKALAEEYLQRPDHEVVGISRTQSITHDRFDGLTLDLSDPQAVSEFTFPLSGDEDSVTLINNAGWLGEVKPFQEQDPDSFSKTQQINLLSPARLIHTFLCQNSRKTVCKILNISSGAGKYPVSSWSDYCTSKAALDMLTRVLAEENPELSIYSVAPGIVDTQMQKEIRKVDPANFPDHRRFVEYHENGDLASPKEVAKVLIRILDDPSLAPGVVFSVRDLNL